MAGNSYTTASRTKILEFLKQNSDRAVNVADIQNYLKACDHEVNITTIYRYMDKLTQDNTVIKYVAEKGNQTMYQFVEQGHHCDEHLHLQCIKCGAIVHLDCSFMKEVKMHAKMRHGFEIQCKNSVIYGLCKNCRETHIY